MDNPNLNQPSKDNEGFTIVGLDQENIKHLMSLKEELLKKERELDLSSRERRYIQNQVAKLDAVPAKYSLDSLLLIAVEPNTSSTRYL
jgi:hypothetical protein